MTLNLENLAYGMTDENESGERDQPSQTISQVYNLLKESVNVHWNGESLRLNAPKGLTTISQVAFRSFEGENLPYLSLDLPELKIELRCFCSPNFQGYVIMQGQDNTEGIFPRKTINDEQSLTEQYADNIITSFSKVWSYDSSFDSQIEYNIEEIVRYLNEVLLQWFGDYSFKTYFGVEAWDKWKEYSFENDYGLIVEGEQEGGILCLGSEENLKKISAITIKENNEIEFTQYSLTTVSYNPVQGASMSKINGTIFIHAGGKQWNGCGFYNTKLNVFEELLNWGQHFPSKLFPNYDYPIAFTPSFAIKFPDRRTSSNLGSMIIYRVSDGKKITIPFSATDFYDLSIAGVYEESETSVIGYVYTSDQEHTSSITLRSFIVSLDWDNLVGTFDLVTVHSAIMTIDEYLTDGYFRLNRGLDWEFHLRSRAEIVISGHVVTGIVENFSGRCVSYAGINGHPSKYRFIRRYHYKDAYVTPVTKCNENQLDDIPMMKITEDEMRDTTRIFNAAVNGYYSLDTQEILFSTSHPVLQLNVSSETGVNSYWQNGKINNYFDNVIMEKFVATKYTSGVAEYPLNQINGHPTFSGELFKYSDGVINYPILLFNNEQFVSFVPVITTNPKYFNIRFNIPQTVDFSKYSTSFGDNQTTVEFHGINQDVLTRLEILIVQQYEYNSLMFRCYNFPNDDNVVFAVNEIARVQFKEMNINGTNMTLTCGVTDSDGNALSLDDLKKIYGKLVLNVDFRGG